MAESPVALITGCPPGRRSDPCGPAWHRPDAEDIRADLGATHRANTGKALAAELPAAFAYRMTPPPRPACGGSGGTPHEARGRLAVPAGDASTLQG